MCQPPHWSFGLSDPLPPWKQPLRSAACVSSARLVTVIRLSSSSSVAHRSRRPRERKVLVRGGGATEPSELLAGRPGGTLLPLQDSDAHLLSNDAAPALWTAKLNKPVLERLLQSWPSSQSPTTRPRGRRMARGPTDPPCKMHEVRYEVIRVRLRSLAFPPKSLCTYCSYWSPRACLDVNPTRFESATRLDLGAARAFRFHRLAHQGCGQPDCRIQQGQRT